MSDHLNLRMASSFPNIWSLLNQRARESLPRGLEEYLSGQFSEEGWQNLNQADKNFKRLSKYFSGEDIGGAYRRDLSGVGDAKKVAELFCELATTVSFAASSSQPMKLKPRNSNGKACDFSVSIEGKPLSVEVKRYDDKDCFERYLSSVDDHLAKEVRNWPRSVEIKSKLKTVPEQLPTDGLSLIMLFHGSIGDSSWYIQKALFGDRTCSAVSDSGPLYEDGLFASSLFETVAGVAHCRINDMGLAKVSLLWGNPKARNPLVDSTHTLVSKIGW